VIRLPRAGRHLDTVGTVLITFAVRAFVFAVSLAAITGPGSASTLIPLGVAALAATALVADEQRHADPLIRPALLRFPRAAQRQHAGDKSGAGRGRQGALGRSASTASANAAIEVNVQSGVTSACGAGVAPQPGLSWRRLIHTVGSPACLAGT
jgi:hypothetical protein